MPFNIGTSAAKKVFFGTTEIKKIFSGATQVWASEDPYLYSLDYISNSSLRIEKYEIATRSVVATSTITVGYAHSNALGIALIEDYLIIKYGEGVRKISTSNLSVMASLDNAWIGEGNMQDSSYYKDGIFYFVNTNNTLLSKINTSTFALTMLNNVEYVGMSGAGGTFDDTYYYALFKNAANWATSGYIYRHNLSDFLKNGSIITLTAPTSSYIYNITTDRNSTHLYTLFNAYDKLYINKYLKSTMAYVSQTNLSSVYSNDLPISSCNYEISTSTMAITNTVVNSYVNNNRLSLQGDKLYFGGSMRCMVSDGRLLMQDGAYSYAKGVGLMPLDFSFKASTGLYPSNGDVMNLGASTYASDNSYIYIMRNTSAWGTEIIKISATDFSYVAKTGTIDGNSSSVSDYYDHRLLWCDGTHLYAMINNASKIYKYLASNMSYVGVLQNVVGNFILVGDYILTFSSSTYLLNKYNKSNLAHVSASSIPYNGNLYPTNSSLYFMSYAPDGAVKKYNVSDFSVVSTIFTPPSSNFQLNFVLNGNYIYLSTNNHLFRIDLTNNTVTTLQYPSGLESFNFTETKDYIIWKNTTKLTRVPKNNFSVENIAQVAGVNGSANANAYTYPLIYHTTTQKIVYYDANYTMLCFGNEYTGLPEHHLRLNTYDSAYQISYKLK